MPQNRRRRSLRSRSVDTALPFGRSSSDSKPAKTHGWVLKMPSVYHIGHWENVSRLSDIKSAKSIGSVLQFLNQPVEKYIAIYFGITLWTGKVIYLLYSKHMIK